MKKLSISEELNQRMMNDFICVNREKNPVIINLNILSTGQIQQVLLQYSIFPKNIISFLVAAAYSVSYHNWTEVTLELTDNVTEELGSGDGKISIYNMPHYTILRRILEGAFGMDVNSVKAGESTNLFLRRVKTLLEDSNPAVVCGAVYGLEASAVPELAMVKEMTFTSLRNNTRELPKYLSEFFDYHVNEIEVGHRDRLMEVISPYLTTAELQNSFSFGFHRVLEIMDEWWSDLYEEIHVPELVLDYNFSLQLENK